MNKCFLLNTERNLAQIHAGSKLRQLLIEITINGHLQQPFVSLITFLAILLNLKTILTSSKKLRMKMSIIKR